MSTIGDALDGLVTRIGDLVAGVPVTRNPQHVRASVAGAGIAVYVRPPTLTGRTMCGLRMSVPVSIVIPTTASQADVERAYEVLPALLAGLGEANATPGPIEVGPDQQPAYTIDHTMEA